MTMQAQTWLPVAAMALLAAVGCKETDTRSGTEPTEVQLEGVLVGGASGEDGNADAVYFSELRVEEITSARAVVRFQTSIPTTCEAAFGASGDNLDRRATDPDMPEGEFFLEHQVPLEDLEGGREYYWQARAVTPEGAVYVSSIRTFKTEPGESTGTPNVALGAMVTGVSSNFGGANDDETWGAAAAIDGLMETEWATDGDGNDAWIELDFGQVRTVSELRFRSRKMSDGTSVTRRFDVLADGQSLGPFETPDPDETYSFTIEPPVETATLRVELIETTGGNTGAKEVQFFQPE